MVENSQRKENEQYFNNLDVLQKKVKEVEDRKMVKQGSKSSSSREFKPPEHEHLLDDLSKKKYAPQSDHKVLRAVHLYNQWRNHRLCESIVSVEIVNASFDLLGSFTEHDLCVSFS